MVSWLLLGLSLTLPQKGMAPHPFVLSNSSLEAKLLGGVMENRIGLSVRSLGGDFRPIGDLRVVQSWEGIEIPKPIQIENWRRSPDSKSADLATVAPNFDDSGWKPVEDFDIPENTVVTFRSHFEVPASLVGSDAAELHVSPVDDHSAVFVNGLKVGESHQWDQPNSYGGIRGVLKPGQNVIAVIVQNDAGPGSMADKVELVTTPKVVGYQRSFQPNTGIVTETFAAGGISYKREAFVSKTDQVLVVHFEASKRNSISFAMKFDAQGDYQFRDSDNRTLLIWNGSTLGIARLMNEGGTTKEGVVAKSNNVTLLFAAVNAQHSDMEAACKQVLEKAAVKSYAELKRRAAPPSRKP